jgi:hypothetical protein
MEQDGQLACYCNDGLVPGLAFALWQLWWCWQCEMRGFFVSLRMTSKNNANGNCKGKANAKAGVLRLRLRMTGSKESEAYVCCGSWRSG